MLGDAIDRRAAELEELAEAAAGEDPAARRAQVARAVRESLGIDRLPRVAPAARTLGTSEHDAFVVERLVFEAVEGLEVPAHLYLPRDAGRVPAVVHPPGHWMENAKLEPSLQRFNARMARSGVAVLCYDTLGQGERRIGWHQHGQLATLLVGFTTLSVMVAESLAALDVLAARPEVDAARLGITGTSGGGWSSIFATALDERIRAAAIVCIVNTHRGQIRAARGTGWDGAVCLCNQLPALAAAGSVSEIMALAAPRALLQVNALDDPPFPIEGARAVAHGLERLYAAAGAATRYRYVEVPGGHGLGEAARDVVCGFLADELSGASVAAEGPPPFAPSYDVTYVDVEGDAGRRQSLAPERREGWCWDAPRDSNGPLLALARARAAALRTTRAAPSVDDVCALLEPLPPPLPLHTRISNRIARAGGHAERISFVSEPGVELDAVLVLPAGWGDDAPPVAVVLDEGGKAEALASSEAARLGEAGFAVLCVDLRGTGESAVAEWESATTAYMLDRDLLAQRAWDVMRSVEMLARRAVVGQQLDRARIAVWGRGDLGLPALVAAVVDPRIAAVGTSGAVASLEELMVPVPEASPMLYRYRLLERLDIADLARLAAPRPVARTVDELVEALA
jgi:cephalosporin-C deacetylase-like acetyl esterase